MFGLHILQMWTPRDGGQTAILFRVYVCTWSAGHTPGAPDVDHIWPPSVENHPGGCTADTWNKHPAAEVGPERSVSKAYKSGQAASDIHRKEAGHTADGWRARGGPKPQPDQACCTFNQTQLFTERLARVQQRLGHKLKGVMSTVNAMALVKRRLYSKWDTCVSVRSGVLYVLYFIGKLIPSLKWKWNAAALPKYILPTQWWNTKLLEWHESLAADIYAVCLQSQFEEVKP